MYVEKMIQADNGDAVKIRVDCGRFVAVFGRFEHNPYNGAPQFVVAYGYSSKSYKTMAAAERAAARYLAA